MDKATQTVLTDLTSEHNNVWSSEMELQVSYTDKSATENDKPVSCLQVFDESTSDMTLSAVVKDHNSVTVSVNVKEDDDVNTSSEISQPSETTAPIHDGNMLPLEPHIIYTMNDRVDSNISVPESEKPCDVSQAGTETNSISYKFEENETSNEEISDHLNAPHVTESMDESTISQTVEQITHVMPLLSMPSNESHVDEPCQEPYESNYHMLSVALEEEHFSPIVERQLPSLTGSSNNRVTVHLGTEKSTSPGSSVMPTEDTDFLTFIPKPNKDSFLLILSPENAESTHFELSTKVEEGVQLIPSASNTTESHSSSLNLNNNFSISSPSQEAHHRTSVPESNNTAPLTSFSVQSNLADSHSHQTDSLFPVTSPALHSVDTKMEDKVHIESPAETIHYTVNDPVGDIVDPTGSSVLYGDIEEIEMKKATKTPHTEQGNVPNEKRLRSEDSSAEMWDILQGLHTCVQEIRDLLMNNGFSSLVDGLTADIKDCNGDEISSNITQLKHLPAVLHSLLQSASESDKHKQAADEPAQVDDITHRSMETQTDRITPIQRQCNSASTLQASIFTHLDEEHNRRILQRSSDQGKIPFHVYQEANRAMSEYHRLRQERLRSLASGYVQYISWNTAENHLQRQCLTRPHIIPALSKIKVLKHQVFLRWKKKREQSQEEKLNLSISLHQILQGVQEDSGIFLIKPVLSWSGRSSMQKGHSQIRSHYRHPQRSRFPPLDQDGILCCGKVPPSMPKEWKTMNTDSEIQPVVVTPKLLEMDVRRYLCKECSVSRICSSPAGLLLRTLPLQKFVSFKQTSSLPAM
ncbi:uncharacterized protein LOC120931453 [Rana temporaria]|uniref:uncharacterized protein LOC120931453 n=1 Tax=Rana temporaria TaxID=8407 RepID=UPI001AADFE77|nr:uncharacterized protein LOC120931453 [Rana temporaria]